MAVVFLALELTQSTATMSTVLSKQKNLTTNGKKDIGMFFAKTTYSIIIQFDVLRDKVNSYTLLQENLRMLKVLRTYSFLCLMSLGHACFLQVRNYTGI